MICNHCSIVGMLMEECSLSTIFSKIVLCQYVNKCDRTKQAIGRDDIYIYIGFGRVVREKTRKIHHGSCQFSLFVQ